MIAVVFHCHGHVAHVWPWLWLVQMQAHTAATPAYTLMATAHVRDVCGVTYAEPAMSPGTATEFSRRGAAKVLTCTHASEGQSRRDLVQSQMHTSSKCKLQSTRRMLHEAVTTPDARGWTANQENRGGAPSTRPHAAHTAFPVQSNVVMQAMCAW